MAEQFLREPTQTEKEERDELGRPTIFLNPNSENKSLFERFNDIVRECESEQIHDLIPFCRRCARLDFQGEIKKIEFELSVSEGGITSEDQLKKIKIPTKEQLKDVYGAKRFIFLNETRATDQASVTVSGQTVRKNVEVGKYRNYQCKERGCGFALFVDKDVKNFKEQVDLSQKPKKIESEA